MPTYGFWSYSAVDYSDEVSTTRVTVPAITAANYEAQNTLRGALRTAIEAVTLGKTIKVMTGNEVIEERVTPLVEESQVEKKWLVRYHDATNFRRYSSEIGVADIADGYLLPQSDMADLTNVDMAALVTAFEAAVIAPITGNGVEVDSIQLVGRKR